MSKSTRNINRKNAVRSAASKAVFEVLEDRKLFSVLTVDGTAGNDVINIYTSGTNICVNDNGVVTSQDASTVDSIVVNAFDGNDRVAGTPLVHKSMTIYGGAGDDSLCGGGGNDFLVGGDGNDILDGCVGSDDLSGGLGTDTANYSSWMTSVHVTLDDMPNDGSAAELDNVHSDVENVNGGAGNDVITGSSAANYLQGGGGTDTLRGMDGNDVLDGGMGGSAPYSKNTGNDTLYGGNGDDTLYASDYGNNRMYGEAGNDSLYGFGGADTLSGGEGNDYLSGGNNSDTLSGGTGDDTILGGAGNDKINGNGGNLSIVIDPLPIFTTVPITRVIDFSPAPTASAPAAAAPAASAPAAGPSLLPIDNIFPIDPIIKLPPIVIVTDNDTIYGGTGNDLIHGNGGNDFECGDAGDDVMYGDDGNDYMLGMAGNDRMYGGAGDDTVCGGDGDDILVTIGGGQNDHLFGENGADSFWMDSESTETSDANLIEALIGNVHHVDAFQTLQTVTSTATTRQTPSRDLNGQNLLDPADSGTTANFSDHPLFASTGPGKDDIRQGGVGDCYFLATLSATAKTNANRIKQSVVDLGDGTYAVQFTAGGSKQFYRVDGDLPVSGTTPRFAKMGGENSNWVAIMEKAFTFFRRNEGTYSSIANGWMSEAFQGLGSSTFSETADGSNILNWLRNELSAGKAVTFATKGSVPVGCPCVGSHAYMVERVNTVTIPLPFGGNVTIPVSVTLRNPWGYDGAGSDSDTSDGYVTLTGDQAAAVLWKAQSAFV